MKNREPKAINTSSTFVTHSCHELGLQALEILGKFTDNTRIIRGGDPTITSNEVVFIKLIVGESRDTFLHIHPIAPTEEDDVRREKFLRINMPWVFKGRVVFINPLHAKCRGRFGRRPLLGFTAALSQLAGYQDLTATERRIERRRTRSQVRSRRVRDDMRA